MSVFDDFIESNEAKIEELQEMMLCNLPVTVETGNLSGHGMEMRFEMIVVEEKVKLFGEDEDVRFNSSQIIFSLFEQEAGGKVEPELDIKYYSVASLGYEDKSTYRFTGDDSAKDIFAWYLSQKETFDIPDKSDEIAQHLFEYIMPVLALLK